MRETPDITRKNQSLDSVSWNILGQVYTPKQMTDDSFSWHATFPEETFVPPHVHPHQDEYIYVLEGRIDLILDGKTTSASAGDLVRMPRGIPHAFKGHTGGLVGIAPRRIAALAPRAQHHDRIGPGGQRRPLCRLQGRYVLQLVGGELDRHRQAHQPQPAQPCNKARQRSARPPSAQPPRQQQQ